MKNKLARRITFQVALVIFGAMLIYAGFQYAAGDHEPGTLLVRHLWHTVVLGGLIYVVLLWRLRALILNPLEQMFFHAYEISKGRFEQHDYPKTAMEIDHVTSMMNLMAAHLDDVEGMPWKDHASSIETHVNWLRERADLPTDVHSNLATIREDLQRLNASMGRIAVQATPQPEA